MLPCFRFPYPSYSQLNKEEVVVAVFSVPLPLVQFHQQGDVVAVVFPANFERSPHRRWNHSPFLQHKGQIEQSLQQQHHKYMLALDVQSYLRCTGLTLSVQILQSNYTVLLYFMLLVLLHFSPLTTWVIRET